MTVNPADGGHRSLGFGSWWQSRGAASALMVGGLLITLLFVPFTITHGPTSFNEERTLLRLDMHWWGLLLGVAPNVLIAAGFWTLRRRVAGSSRLAVSACMTICAVLGLSAIGDLAFRALGPPFGLLYWHRRPWLPASAPHPGALPMPAPESSSGCSPRCSRRG